MSKKILVYVWEPLLQRLNEKCVSACLRRDGYLDKVLSHEANALDREISGRNSDEANTYLAKQLGLLPRKQLNLLLSDSTIDAINDVCARKNTPRDSFVNRVLLLLGASSGLLKSVLNEIDWEWAHGQIMDEMPDEKYVLFENSQLGAIAEIINMDPFWYQRRAIDFARKSDSSIPLLHQTKIEKTALGKLVKSALGFNCFIEDRDIEGHPAQKADDAEAARLLDELLGPSPTVQEG